MGFIMITDFGAVGEQYTSCISQEGPACTHAPRAVQPAVYDEDVLVHSRGGGHAGLRPRTCGQHEQGGGGRGSNRCSLPSSISNNSITKK